MMYGVGMQSIDPKTLGGMVIHPVAVVESKIKMKTVVTRCAAAAQ